MSKFNPRLHAIRECRSLLLDYLNASYPASLDEEMILDVMMELPTPIAPDNVRRDLEYLKQSRLIDSEVIEHPVKPRCKSKRWKLTARGLRFMERDKPWDELEVID